MNIHPYQMMQIVAKVGDGAIDEFNDTQLNTIVAAIRKRPSLPLTLRCMTSSTYDYQNPISETGAPENMLFHRYRDLKILQMLGLVPGDTRPALELFNRLLENIKTAKDILWFDEITSEDWKGEPKSDSYEKGVEKGIESIIPNVRPKKLRLQVKKQSAKELLSEKKLRIRPHHLMCMACFYRGPDDLTPLEEDNIFEVIGIMHKNPNISIELIEGTCMICTPCHAYDPEIKKCVTDVGMSLRDELKDLYILRILGLKYGDVMPANELYKLLFERIKSTPEVCGFGERKHHSREWRPCGGVNGIENYKKTRNTGLLR